MWQPTLTYRIGPPHSLIVEQELAGHRWEMITRYVADNSDLNPMLVDPADAWLGIVASGHIAEMVMEALRILGLDRRELHDLGVRVLKLGVLNPLDERSTRQLAAGTSTVLVVEDKLEWLETRVRAALYGSGSSPAIVGKKDAGGRALVPATGALTADSLVEPLRRILLERIGPERLAPPKPAESFKLVLGAEAQRTPFFCSGCPHNTGLLVPDGSLVGAGIGCHGMVSMIGRPQTGEVVSITAMGGEGAEWVGCGTVRRRSPHVPERWRRHVLPLRPTGDSVRRLGRRHDHVQDPLQRRGGDDRRPGRSRRPAGAGCRRQAAGRRRQAGGHHHRRPGQVPRRQRPPGAT